MTALLTVEGITKYFNQRRVLDDVSFSVWPGEVLGLAIVTLGFTVGTWALDFIAAGRGGLLQQLANYTPTAALRSFEQGLLRSEVFRNGK